MCAGIKALLRTYVEDMYMPDASGNGLYLHVHQWPLLWAHLPLEILKKKALNKYFQTKYRFCLENAGHILALN